MLVRRSVSEVDDQDDFGFIGGTVSWTSPADLTNDPRLMLKLPGASRGIVTS